MSTGAITLQCPECGGVFLTLQHTGQTEICPHCAVSGPRTSFRRVSDPPSQRGRTDLPEVRMAETETASSPSFAGATRSRVLDTPFPLAPEFFSASRTAVATAAPEQAAPSSPAESPFQIADVPPMPAFKEPAYKNGSNGNGHAHAEAPTPTKAPDAGPVEGILPIPDFPSKNPSPFTAEAKTPSVPVWPGLDLDKGTSAEAETPAQPAESTGAPPVTKTPERLSVPAKPHRIWPRLALVSTLALCAGWMLWQRNHPAGSPPAAPEKPTKPVVAQSQPAPVPQPVSPPAEAPKPSVASISSAPPPSPAPAPAPVKPQTPEAAPPAEPAPVTTTLPAIPAGPLSDAALLESAAKIIKTLDTAKTTPERLAVIADPAQRQAQVESFFKANQGGLQAQPPEASSGSIVVMPGGHEAKLFRLITQRCPEGALLYFHENSGKLLLDWPLFSQSHEHAYDQFILAEDVKHTQAQSFTLLCRRTQASAIKGAEKDQWISLEAQGSLAASGAAIAYVKKDTAIGKYLDSKLGWDRIYLLDLRLEKQIVSGVMCHVITDCKRDTNDTPKTGAKK